MGRDPKTSYLSGDWGIRGAIKFRGKTEKKLWVKNQLR